MEVAEELDDSFESETGASVVQGPSGKLMALVSARVRVVAAWLKSVELQLRRPVLADRGVVVSTSGCEDKRVPGASRCVLPF